jgi:hypothetical protein
LPELGGGAAVFLQIVFAIPSNRWLRGQGALRSNKAPNFLRQGIVQLQQKLAVRWAIEIYRNLSQFISLLYLLTAELRKQQREQCQR